MYSARRHIGEQQQQFPFPGSYQFGMVLPHQPPNFNPYPPQMAINFDLHAHFELMSRNVHEMRSEISYLRSLVTEKMLNSANKEASNSTSTEEFIPVPMPSIQEIVEEPKKSEPQVTSPKSNSESAKKSNDAVVNEKKKRISALIAKFKNGSTKTVGDNSSIKLESVEEKKVIEEVPVTPPVPEQVKVVEGENTSSKEDINITKPVSEKQSVEVELKDSKKDITSRLSYRRSRSRSPRRQANTRRLRSPSAESEERHKRMKECKSSRLFDKSKTVLCQHTRDHHMRVNEKCFKAHSYEELVPCINGHNCSSDRCKALVHSERELRILLHQTRRLKSAPCRHYSQLLECPHGDRCNYIHFDKNNRLVNGIF
jgi:hypothetical protein